MAAVIINATLVPDGNTIIENGYILFDETGILALGTDFDQSSIKCDVYDAKGNWVIPGFCDVHNHGAVNVDFVSCGVDGLQQVADYLVNEGVTSFLASTTVLPKEAMIANAERLGQYQYHRGAECLGIHMEGPFMNPKYHAMMKVDWLRSADWLEYQQWQQASQQKIRMVTLAPEVAGAQELIAKISNEVAVMIGHTDASVEQVHLAKLNGARGFTHFYNAMSQHQHRNPGVVTAGLMEQEMYLEMICDGMHLHPDVVKMTYQLVGPQRIVLITDAMPGKGMPDGRFFFCGEWVEKINGKTHLVGDTRIAGSILPFNLCAKQMMQWSGCSINDIVQMGCVNPHLLLKDQHRGTLQVGKISDILIIDREFNPEIVFTHGEPHIIKEHK
jgi:N-acetylglucosamine-6-phosphate deacetylase